MGRGAPYSAEMVALATPVESKPEQHVGELVVEPVTRVGGALGLRVTVDSRANRYAGARCAPGMFRGYEAILSGRDVRDAIYLSSRCCGYHGGQHSAASAQAVEMALGIDPPPMAVAIRNIGLSAEMIHAEAAHLFLLAGPDFSGASIAANFPDLWAVAQRTPAPHAEIHGYGTIGDVMSSLDPLTGRWYRDAFSVARIPYQMYAIVLGKYPHPQSMVPGGVSTMMSNTTVSGVHDYVVRLLSLVDPAKRVAVLITDLLDFCEASIPQMNEVGTGPLNFIDSGLWDDPEGYDSSWEGLTSRGERRWAAPGVVLDGQLVTSDLREVAEGIEETVEHSFYEAAGALPPFERRTLPMPGHLSWEGRYSWSASARWKGQSVETGPGARLWTTALRGRMDLNPFVSARDGGVQLALPDGGLPEMVLEWRPPAVWNAIERTRARLYGIVFAALVGANQALKVLDLQKQGRCETSTPVERLPKRGARRGVGFAGDGLLGHWVTLDGPTMTNYQVISPSTFNLGPGGPAEQAVDGTPVLGITAAPSGLEALIALRSLDPCVNCATH